MMGANIWLSKWSDDERAFNSSQKRREYLGVYASFGLAQGVFGSLQSKITGCSHGQLPFEPLGYLGGPCFINNWFLFFPLIDPNLATSEPVVFFRL